MALAGIAGAGTMHIKTVSPTDREFQLDGEVVGGPSRPRPGDEPLPLQAQVVRLGESPYKRSLTSMSFAPRDIV